MKLRIFSFFASSLFLLVSCAYNNRDENVVQKESFRGVVLYPSDMRSLGASRLISILKKADINLIGIHSNTITEDLDSLKVYLESADGRLFRKLCKEHKIDIEYECHVLQEILPRSLFDEHPEYFRIDSNGVRNKDLNICFSSEEAWNVIERNLTELVKWVQPTTNRYFFWIDDSYDGFCQCDKCYPFTPSDQALIYENRMLEIIRKVNPDASLAHLAYASTLQAPKMIKPQKGIFLEFAPIGRNYANTLSSEQYNALHENLEIFPKETAHILEYWLDASMFSGWNRDNWGKVHWDTIFFKRDVELYRSLGIESFTTFATWMLHQRYFELYGQNDAIKVLEEYGSILIRKELKH